VTSLREPTVVGVVGLREERGRVGPHVFEEEAELDALRLDPRWQPALFVATVLDGVPSGRLAVIVRGCDERALVEMAKQGRLDLDRLVMIGLACDEAQVRACRCRVPRPTTIDVGDEAPGVAAAEDDRLQALAAMSVEERRAFWEAELSKCIKCYGCRNACPVCLCDVCILEESCWVEQGRIPPSMPFHLIRAWHVADRCVVCGACEAACPMDIPLTTLHAAMHESLGELLGYTPGRDVAEISPLVTTLDEDPLRGGAA
jgi:ferredoxin